MSDAKHFDVIVLGVGTMGSAACYHLANRGAKVLGLDQFSIPSDLGSAHGESRIVRLCYYEHPDYVPLLKRAYELWDELGNASGTRILHRTGGIFMGTREGAFVRETLRAAELYDLPCELIERDALMQQYPQFHLPEDYVGLHEPNAGYVLPEAAVTAHANLAMRHGAILHGHEPARSWSVGDDHITVETDRGTYTADKLVISGGAWMGRIMNELNLPLTVTRQAMGWVQPKAPERFSLGAFPVWAYEQPDGSLHYGFPILPNRPGVKVAHHWQGEKTDPEIIDRIPRTEDEHDFRDVIRELLPDADGPLLAMRICMYTNTPDGHFIIDHHPHHDRVVIAGGFSGHGFKFAPVVGETLAGLALEGRTSHPVEFLSTQRFTPAT